MRLLRCLPALLLVLPSAAHAQRAEPDTGSVVSVNATGNASRDPDQALLQLAVESNASSARDAARANATKMDRLVTALREAGITGNDVRTVSYQLQPQYDYGSERVQPPRIVGYQALNMVQVTINDVKAVGRIVDVAVEAGSNRITGLSFQLKDWESAHLEAVREATRKAREEAEAVATALGMTVGRVMSVNTSGYYPPPPPMPVAAVQMRAMDKASAPTPVEAGAIDVSATVSAVFRLERGR